MNPRGGALQFEHHRPPPALSAAITRHRALAPPLALPLTLMIGGDAQLMPAAWEAPELQWYADFVAHCQGQSRDPPDVSAVLRLDAAPLDECLFMHGTDDLDGRFEDSASLLWSHDRHGRWFAKVERQTVWLQAKLAQLRYRRAPRRAHNQQNFERDSIEVVSHICGNCDCIRLQHIRYQSKSEDARDRAHHRAHGSSIRPDLLAQLTPKCPPADPNFTDLPEREITPRLTSFARRLRARTTHIDSAPKRARCLREIER